MTPTSHSCRTLFNPRVLHTAVVHLLSKWAPTAGAHLSKWTHTRITRRPEPCGHDEPLTNDQRVEEHRDLLNVSLYAVHLRRCHRTVERDRRRVSIKQSAP